MTEDQPKEESRNPERKPYHEIRATQKTAGYQSKNKITPINSNLNQIGKFIQNYQ